MKKSLVIETGNKILNNFNYFTYAGSLAEMKNLIAAYDGKLNEFYKATKEVNDKSPIALDNYKSVLKSFIETVEKDLLYEVSFTRKLKLQIVNEYLKQAEKILYKKELHPAGAAVLIGASLEEFLRNWATDENVLPSKISIDTLAVALKNNDFINTQDHKDILSWGGIRNDAAHGHWDKVSKRETIELMLAGVNIFIKKYSK